MYSFKLVVFVLALILAVATTNARPVSHRRRNTCKPPVSASSVPTASAIPSLSIDSGDVDVASPTPSAKPSSKPSSGSEAPSKPSSTSHASSSSSTKVPASAGNLLDALLPISANKKWTTASGAPGALPLSDKTLRPDKMISALSHNYVEHAGKDAMQAHYPEGSYTFGHQPEGGISFYAPGPQNVDLTTAKEATFGYSVYFPAGFEFNMGGKLPGLYGGDSEEEAVSCSGGRRSKACFSARLMWRDSGKGEMYTYLPMDDDFSVNKKQCNVAPYSECNPTYGASVGRGSFKFATGGWTTVSERVRLNDPGQDNGELQLFVNGESVINVSGLKLREGSDGRIRGIQMQTFFGGHDSSWASPKDQDVFFADFSTAITETL